MGQRNLRTRRSPQSGCDARNNFELDVRLAEGCDFFANPPEDQGIAALEAHHLQSGGSQSDHEEVDLFLADVLFSAALANVLNLRVGRHEVKYLFSDKIVVQHNIGAPKQPGGFESEQFGIAGAGADQVDFACHTSALLPFAFESAAIVASNASALASDCKRNRLRSGSRLLARTLSSSLAQFRDPMRVSRPELSFQLLPDSLRE